MGFVESTAPEYAALTAHAARASPTGLLAYIKPPAPRRFAAFRGPFHDPFTVAILSAYPSVDLHEPSTMLDLYLVDNRGQPVIGSLGELTCGEAFLHLELIESLVRGQGHGRRLIDALSDFDLLVSPAPDVYGVYERWGFEPLAFFDAIPSRPLMYRPSR